MCAIQDLGFRSRSFRPRWSPASERGSVQAAPGADEYASSKLWLYRSVLTQQTDANSGLVGPIIVAKPGVANPDGSPSDVDVEFVTLYQVRAVAKTPCRDSNRDRRIVSSAEFTVVANVHMLPNLPTS